MTTSAANNNTNNNSTAKPAVNDSTNTSCSKCVKVLRDLVSGLQSLPASTTTTTTKEESKPLQLLRAIASAGGDPNEQVKIENVDDGIKMIIPVKTTSPNLLRRWSSWSQEQARQATQQQGESSSLTTPSRFGMPSAVVAALATSATPPPEQNNNKLNSNDNNNNLDDDSNLLQPPTPLTIELKCRKCASTGPEGGARAFLMGPTPLSVVVCHNRIHSSQHEIQEILTHELIHLYDVQTQKLDLQQCENLAYSEVRAAKHAECKDSWKQLQSFCVKQKAICATNNLFPTEGRKCIQRVFDQAFEDNRPFPTNNNTATTSSGKNG